MRPAFLLALILAPLAAAQTEIITTTPPPPGCEEITGVMRYWYLMMMTGIFLGIPVGVLIYFLYVRYGARKAAAAYAPVPDEQAQMLPGGTGRMISNGRILVPIYRPVAQF